MTSINQQFIRDANHVPITYRGLTVSKTIVYNGTTGAGAIGITNLFSVTGTVIMTIFAECTETLVGDGASISVGTQVNPILIIPATVATTISDGEVWNDDTPALFKTAMPDKILTNGTTSIVELVTSAAITDGSLTYYCTWIPISDDGEIISVN